MTGESELARPKSLFFHKMIPMTPAVGSRRAGRSDWANGDTYPILAGYYLHCRPSPRLITTDARREIE
jgi:hypothetical protein